jgi:hypothetical protein
MDSTFMLPLFPEQFPHKEVQAFDWADWFLGYLSAICNVEHPGVPSPNFDFILLSLTYDSGKSG